MGKSIADYGGLKPFLDGTKALHNGLGYNDLINLYKKDGGNIAKLCRDFNVTRPTMYNWFEIAGLPRINSVTAGRDNKDDWI